MRISVVSIVSLLALAAFARADEIVQFGLDNRTPGVTLKDVTILALRGDDLTYRTPGGEERTVQTKKVFRLSSTTDPALTAAEAAYTEKQFDKAIDNYQKVTRATVGANDGWKIVWSVPRLLDAAEKTKRFDAALAGYIGLCKVDPTAALNARPALPAKGSKFLDDAARDLDAAARSSTKDLERQALLTLLLDVQLARADQAAAEAVVDQLLKLAGPSANDPQLAGLVANTRLAQARVAAEAKRWPEVITAIDAAAPRLAESKQQADALFLRATAMAGLAKRDDKNAQLDVALAYMRVVAHFGALDGRPQVAPSLLGAAAALEAAGDLSGARALYEQTAAEFSDTPYAAEARQRLDRLAENT